jgi:hypothetical protein
MRHEKQANRTDARRIGVRVQVLVAVSLPLIVAAAWACNGLLPVAGQQVDCNITGTVVGIDGGAVMKIDIGWFPTDELGVSDGLVDGNIDGSTFTLTMLTVADGATRVEGELLIGEVPIPPLPQRYDQMRVAIDLPVNQCEQDLGEIQLPLKGTTPQEDAGTNSTEADAGIDSADEETPDGQ